ncbi:MAG TPA: hypothetical protein PLO84_06090 [Thermotogota bacterium]|nr:hypothetical protein [Thermotogota bacterium]
MSRGIEMASQSLVRSVSVSDYLFLILNSAAYFIIGLITFEVILAKGKQKGINSNY